MAYPSGSMPAHATFLGTMPSSYAPITGHRPVYASFPAALLSPAGSIAASAEFSDSELIEILIRAQPDLTQAALPHNPNLPLEIWKRLYSFKPKATLDTALALTSRPLSFEQLEHMKPERRQSIWSQVYANNLLPAEMVKYLASSGRLNPRLPAPRMTIPLDRQTKVALTQLVEEVASSYRPSYLFNSHELRGPSVNYLKANLQSGGSWEVLFSIVNSFTGTIKDLVDVCNALTASES